MAPLDAVLERLDNPRQHGDKWTSRCPAHPDGNPSFGVWLGDNGAVILNCQAGCSKEDILAALNMKWSDLYPRDNKRTNGNGGFQIVATYPYVDEAGDLLYEVVRLSPKDFRQRRPNGQGGHVWGRGGARRVLYRLPDVIEAAASGTTVLIVEGEKDVHALEAAGYVATTCPEGAGKWRPEYTAVLKGAEVVVVADKDKPGRAHARAVAEAVEKVAASVRCAEARTGKDVSDHLAAGLDVENLELIEDRWAAADEADDPVDDDDPDGDDLHASLHPVDLAPVLDGTVSQPIPDMVLRDDGAGLLYAGAVNGIHGDSGAGKGWVVAYTVRENARRGKRSLILDFEDTSQSITARLIEVGLTAEQIMQWVEYVRPEVPLGPRAVAHFCDLIRRRNIAFTVIDSLGEAFATESIDENKDVEVGPWFRSVARPLADTGTTLLLVDHSTKASDNPLHPSGSKRKRAAVTGASYLAEAVQPFVKGAGGRLRLTCAKDRHGCYRRSDPVADLVMTSQAVGVDLTLYAPTPRDEGEQQGVDVELAARAAVRAAAGEGRPLSRNALEQLMKVKARASVKRAGIDLAAGRGWLDEGVGPRNARVFTAAPDAEGKPDA